jgi:hypothetical protein
LPFASGSSLVIEYRQTGARSISVPQSEGGATMCADQLPSEAVGEQGGIIMARGQGSVLILSILEGVTRCLQSA